MTKCNPLMRQKSEQDRLALLWLRVEAERRQRSMELENVRAVKAATRVLAK